jgi:alpha-L-rhamnosidase
MFSAVRPVLLLGLLLLGQAGYAEAPDPRGPIEYPGMKVTVDRDGVQAPGFEFSNEPLRSPSLRLRWISVPGNSPPVTMFRKVVRLKSKPDRVTARITADTKYRLYINGRLVSRGPVDIGRDYAGGNTGRWFYNCRDLTPYFHKGKNAVAAEVFHQWPIGFTVSYGHADFAISAEIDGRPIDEADSPWRAHVAMQYPDAATYKAAKEPGGWRLADFDDSSWPTCDTVGRALPLVPSEIPPLMEVRYPVLRIEGLANRTMTADDTFRVVFDRVLSGYPTLKVKGGKGATITIRAHRTATVLPDGRECCFEFPFLTEIAPAFTVEVKHLTTPLEIVDVGAVFTAQPVGYRGSFECSDENLNRLWKTSRWAVEICQQTHHLDSPNHQEPICDPGDYVIEAMTNYYAFAQPWLARQDLRKFAWLLKDEKYRNFHTSYSIAWLQMLMDYYDYTGDRALVEELEPYVRDLLKTYRTWRGDNGLISEAPNYMFMDWVTIGGFNCHHPPAVIGQGYLTALYYHALEMASRVAELTGDTRRVATYAWLREMVAADFNRELWDAKRGLYRDGKPFQTSVKPHQWLPADRRIETFSPHVNLLAVLYDLTPSERRAAIVAKVLADKPLNVQPWFMHWVFPAVDHAGLFDRHGTELLRRWRIVPETQSFREMWNGGDLSHGWCSTPLVQLSARVLGVTPSSPGFKTIAIRPTLCELRWAKGAVPTPHGDVAVSWRSDDRGFHMDVTIPPDTAATVTLPVERFEKPTAWLDGKSVEPTTRITAGTHHFEIRGKPRSWGRLPNLPDPMAE